MNPWGNVVEFTKDNDGSAPPISGVGEKAVGNAQEFAAQAKGYVVCGRRDRGYRQRLRVNVRCPSLHRRARFRDQQTLMSLVVRRGPGGWRCVSAQNTDIIAGMETNVVDASGHLLPADYTSRA